MGLSPREKFINQEKDLIEAEAGENVYNKGESIKRLDIYILQSTKSCRDK